MAYFLPIIYFYYSPKYFFVNPYKPYVLKSLDARYPYRSIRGRVDFLWPKEKRLAVYLGFNIENFSFGEGLGANIGPVSKQPDVLNYMWRDYGNRVGVWRCLDLFDQLNFPTGTLINTSLYDYCPEVIKAFVERGDELIGHGHTNSQRQSDMSQEEELGLLRYCKEKIKKESGRNITGWLSPWISETFETPDLLAQANYDYTLNWCNDDQPFLVKTTQSVPIWSIPYPQELNDIPMIIHRQMSSDDFSQMIIDQFDEMLDQTRSPNAPQSLVMGIALHPYIVGQPYRLKHLRRALQYIARSRQDIWLTTPGEICSHMRTLTLSC